MVNNLKNYALILASGTGTRFKTDIPKQFVEICGKTILERTIEIFEKNNAITSIILVITPEYKTQALELIKNNCYKKIVNVLSGGKTRKESSYIGISAIEENDANVFIHDCARPFLSQSILNKCIKALTFNDAVDVAVKSTDTILQVKDGFIENIPERKSLMRSQTPQCFKLSLIKKAHELSKNDTDFTDDCGLVIKHNLAKIFIVEGEETNIKITYSSDKVIAENVIKFNEEFQ